MASQLPITLYKDALILLTVSALVVPLARRVGITPIFVFILGGIALGPFGLGRIASDVAPLSWVTLGGGEGVAHLGELGVVFLLFFIGLELSFERLKTMGRLVFGLGALQVLISTSLLALIARPFGLTIEAAILVGVALSLSSTAVVVELLARAKRLSSVTGRVSFSVLIFQDLAVIPVLFLVSALGQSGGGAGDSDHLLAGLGLAFAQAAMVVGAIIVVGRSVLRPFFRIVAATHAPEAFMAAVILVVVGTSLIAASVGMSMALGAFIAGLLLAETEFRRAIEATAEPFKGLLLGVFFFSVGMNVDPLLLVLNPFVPILLSLLVITIKALVFAPLAVHFGIAWPAALRSALLLGPAGEFAFVILGVAGTMGLVDTKTATLVMSVATLTMVSIPALDWLGRRLTPAKPNALIDAAGMAPSAGTKGAIVVGYGRVGQLIAEMLQAHKIAYVAIDKDVASVAKLRGEGHEVFYGDAANPHFLERCGIREASALILTVHSNRDIEAVMAAAQSLNATIPIIVRARDAEHARKLYRLGATNAVPETIEASLQLSEAALLALDVPLGRIIPTIHDKRDGFRKMLSPERKPAPEPPKQA